MNNLEQFAHEIRSASGMIYVVDIDGIVHPVDLAGYCSRDWPGSLAFLDPTAAYAASEDRKRDRRSVRVTDLRKRGMYAVRARGDLLGWIWRDPEYHWVAGRAGETRNAEAPFPSLLEAARWLIRGDVR